MLARIVPGIIPPTIGTAVLSDNPRTAFSGYHEYVYTISAPVTVSFAPPPGSFGWRAFAASSASSSGPFTSIASSLQLTLVNGVNNVVLTLLGSVPVSHYVVMIVAYTDQFGNILQNVATSNAVQMPAKRKLLTQVYYDVQTSFSPTSGASTFDVLFTSKGGRGYGEIPGGYASGGGGAGVKITGLTASPSDTFFVETRMSQGFCFLRRDSAVSTSNQIYATNGVDAIALSNGANAPAATLSGVFAGATVVYNNPGNNPDVIVSEAEEFAATSGLFYVENPMYPGFPLDFPSSALFGAAGFVPNEGTFPSFIPRASAFGCAGLGVTFPEGVELYGRGMSGVVEVTYYE
jgi:hypothetical protein